MHGVKPRRATSARFAAFAAVSLAGLLLLGPLQGCLVPGSAFDAELFVGSYVGTWQSETTGESGPAQIDISVNLATQTATLSLDFGGNYLGLDDPPAHEISGGFDENGAHMQGQDTLFGNYDVLVAADGSMVGVFRDVADGSVAVLTYTGRLTGAQITADYDVVFADGRISHATATLTKQ